MILSRLIHASVCIASVLQLSAADESPIRRGLPQEADLQAILNDGGDLVLQPGTVYPITRPLKFTTPNQRISTLGAIHPSEYAVLRIIHADCAQLIDGNQIDGIVLEKLTLDGNRYMLSDVGDSPTRGQALVQLGGEGAENQVIRECVMMSTRSWTTLKLHEGAHGIRAESNIILGAGSDIRGNGRDARERLRSWGDGISCAARASVVRDNLILDATDGAIVVFAAPGSIIENNIIGCISREALGGINLVDPMPCYPVDGDTNKSDYRGTIIRNNQMDAFGGRLHIAIAMGAGIWTPRLKDHTLVGASVVGNSIRGGAAAYGFVANGIESFTVTGNSSSASHSGVAEGEPPKFPPAQPGPFLYQTGNVSHSTLQPEFIQPKDHLIHLLRCNHLRPNRIGYQPGYGFGEAEINAVVQAAYLEMLGRQAEPNEVNLLTQWLLKAKGNADDIRRNLMMSHEFTARSGFVPPEELHPWRLALWLNNLDKASRSHLATHGRPTAERLYKEAMAMLVNRPQGRDKILSADSGAPPD